MRKKKKIYDDVVTLDALEEAFLYFEYHAACYLTVL